MRLYLSSYRLGRQSEALKCSGGRALIVMNALDEYPDRLASWGRETTDLEALGYSCDELDLRQYWGKDSEGLRDSLRSTNLLWVVGGNAFVLARAATAAGLRAALIAAPDLTYAGYSAGACLTSVDLQGIEHMDDPATLPASYHSDMPAEPLRLTDTRVIPHAGTPDAIKAVTALQAAGITPHELRDGEDWITSARRLEV